MSLDTFTRAYVECALWSSTGDDGEPLDDGRDYSDIAPETLSQMKRDCDAFRDAYAGDLVALDAEQAGYDFWLTRHHHGAGFWDRGLGALGDRLTVAAQTFPEVCLYVGDDGKVHQ